MGPIATSDLAAIIPSRSDLAHGVAFADAAGWLPGSGTLRIAGARSLSRETGDRARRVLPKSFAYAPRMGAGWMRARLGLAQERGAARGACLRCLLPPGREPEPEPPEEPPWPEWVRAPE